MQPKARISPPILLAVAAALAIALGLEPQRSPEPASANAPANAFSAGRAQAHVAALAATPRAVGATGHTSARAYIEAQLRDMGLEPVSQKTTVVHRFPGATEFNGAVVQNVMARRSGLASTGTVVLEAHYDSGSTGPGAGDCAVGVAAVLETARAMQAAPAMRNDVVFLFSDAEEVGDLGARAFVTRHPWASTVRAAVVFEGMGSSGPSIMYRSSLGDGPLVAAWASSSARPLTNSFLTNLVQFFPEQRLGCDLEEFLDAGIAGMAFVHAGDLPAYHTRLDTADRLDAATLQHHGDNAVALAQSLGSTDLTSGLRGSQSVYFNLTGAWLIRYSVGFAYLFGGASIMAVLALLWLGVRRGRWRVRTVLLGLGLALGGWIVPWLVVVVTWGGLRAADDDLRVFLVGTYGHAWIVAGLFGVAATAGIAWTFLWQWRRNDTDVDALTAGALAMWAGLLALLLVYMPGASYLAQWPLLACAALLGRRVWRTPNLGARDHDTIDLLLLALTLAVTLHLWIMTSTMLFPAFMARLEAMAGGVPMLAMTGVLFAVVPTLLWPQLAALRRWRGPTLVGSCVLTVAAMTIGIVQSGFDARQPRPDHLRWELDTERSAAWWVSHDRVLDDWTSRFIPAGTARSSDRSSYTGASYRTPAPSLRLQPPHVVVLADRRGAGQRELTLNLRSPRPGADLRIEVETAAPLQTVAVDGEVLDLHADASAAAGRLVVNFAAPPAMGITLSLAAPDGPVHLLLTDISVGFPTLPGFDPGPRPTETMPAPGWPPDAAHVAGRVLLP